MAVYRYYPEMKEAKPKAQIEASMAHGGKHYFLYTPLELKGRGVKLVKTYKNGSELSQYDQYKVGWNVYQVTCKAYDAIKSQYSVSYECLFD